jgi:hypothetical protein
MVTLYTYLVMLCSWYQLQHNDLNTCNDITIYCQGDVIEVVVL